MPQSQTAALPRHQDEEETDKTKQSQSQAAAHPKHEEEQTKLSKRKSNKRTKSTKISSLFPKRGNRNAKRTEKYKKKITQDKTRLKANRLVE